MAGGEGLQVENGEVVPPLTVRQAAKYTAVSERLVRQWVADGQLPAYRFGAKGKRGHLRIRRDDLERLVATARTTEVPPPAPPPAPPPLARKLVLKHLRLP